MGERKKLDSWKQIGDFLGYSPRTAQRHAKDRKMPVHYVGGARGTRVFAFADELEEWLRTPAHPADEPGTQKGEGEETASKIGTEYLAAAKPDPQPAVGGAIQPGFPPPAELAWKPGPSSDLPVPPLRPTAKEWASSLAAQMLLQEPEEPETDLLGDSLPTWKGARIPPAPIPPQQDPAVRSGNENPASPSKFLPAGQMSAGMGRARGRPGRILLLLGIALPLIVLLAVLVWRGWPASKPPNHIAGVQEKGKTLIALDASGRALWRREFPLPYEGIARFFAINVARGKQQSATVIDLDGDGRQEVLAVTGRREPEEIVPWVLYCLDDRGAILWQYTPAEALAFRRERCDANWALCFEVADLDVDGRQEIIVLSHNHRLFPSKITLLDPQGRNRGDYLNSGWVETIKFADLDGDGTQEILAGGCNNGYRRPCLFALRVDRIAGCSPQPDNPDYQCPGRPPGREMYYLLLPRDPLSRQLHPIGTVQSILLTPDQVIAAVPTGIQDPPLTGGIDFMFDHRLRLEQAEANSVYELLYGRFFQQGLLDRPFSPAVVREMDPILYWDGDRFVTTPTVNRHWREPASERLAGR